MIGQLSNSIAVGGRDIKLKNTDFRAILVIVQALNDSNLSEQEKAYVLIDGMIGVENIDDLDINEIMTSCARWIDGGASYNDDSKAKPKLMDWEQDEQMIFSAVNRIAGKETRIEPYLHWWTFIGYFNEIKDGLFADVLAIRSKKAKHKKLDKNEQEFYQANKKMIDLKTAYTEEEKAEIDRLKALLG